VWSAFGGVGFGPGRLISDHLELEPLKRETETEDDVACARDPDGAVELEDAARLLQPPDIEPVSDREPFRDASY
jgi:hypothetical protein